MCGAARGDKGLYLKLEARNVCPLLSPLAAGVRDAAVRRGEGGRALQFSEAADGRGERRVPQDSSATIGGPPRHLSDARSSPPPRRAGQRAVSRPTSSFQRQRTGRALTEITILRVLADTKR